MNFEKSLFLKEYEPDCFVLKNKDFFVGVWHFDFLFVFYKEFENLLSVEEKEKYFSFNNESYKIRKIVSRGLLRKVLGFIFENEKIDFYYNEYGKPFLKKNPIYFNVSHASKHVMIGLGQNPIGVDIEDDFFRFSLERMENMARRFFHPQEYEVFLKVPSCEKIFYFLEVWTQKEAYLKCEGTGISQELSRIKLRKDSLNNDFLLIDDNEYNFIHKKMSCCVLSVLRKNLF